MKNTIANEVDLNKRYKDDLDKAVKYNENRLVLNDGPIKASILMNTLIGYAKKSIYIYSKMLNNEVTGISNNDTGLDNDFLNVFTRALEDKQIEVKIILNQMSNNDKINELLNTYCEKGNEYNNSYKLLDNKCIMTLFNKDVHFVVIDDIGYRLEHDIINYRADANFNNPKMAKGLKELFTYMYKKEC